MKQKLFWGVRYVALFYSSMLATGVAADGLFDSFLDPGDGMLDVSEWVLDNATGFLPVPVIITEPALGGFGLGIAPVFFHEDKDEKQKRQAGEIERSALPPSVSALAAAYTANDSWIVGGGHMGSYKKDRIRYSGTLGYAEINLKFYGAQEDSPIDSDGEEYKIKGTIFSQDLRFRIGQSNLFLGGRYSFLGTETKFESTDVPGLRGEELESSTAIFWSSAVLRLSEPVAGAS